MFWVIYLGLSLCLLNFRVTTTDIASIYKHGIILIKGAESITTELPLEAEHLQVKLSKDFAYPIALAHDPYSGKLFVADANNRETDIFSVTFEDESTISVNSLITKLGFSTIESISYDPVFHQLLWTDSSKNKIYSASLKQTDRESFVPNLVFNKDVKNPRGITMDYCRRNAFWTEREEGKRSIEQYNIESGSIELVEDAKENIYFQGVDYNSFTDELVWAETTGDEEEVSSCNIVVMSLTTKKRSILNTFENCYPFSLTSDKDFIYWSDWSRQGIMRLSRENPKELVKLVSTPQITTEQGAHNGAFGIVNLNEIPQNKKDLCPSRLTLTDKSSDGNANFPLKHSNYEEFLQGTAKTEASLLQNKLSPDQSQSFDSNLEDIPTYQQLRLIIIILSITCFLFMVSTLYLLVRNCISHERYINSWKGLFTRLQTTVPFEAPKTLKTPRRFGPKLKTANDQLYPRNADDGFRIDIEDCCQMTLCDTPCYTSMKKDGKEYKSKKEEKWEDKKNLLEDLA